MPSANAIASALLWVQSVLLGSVAGVLAVLAIAAVGLLMLTGRIDGRRAATVVAGCFIIFGASTIATGILGTFSGQPAGYAVQAETNVPYYPPSTAASGGQSAYDPYAGAALAPRQ